MFVEKPHLPNGDANLVLCSKNVPKEMLSKINTTTVQSYEHNNILSGINDHPDMTFCHLENSLAVVPPSAYSYYREKLKDFNIIKGDNEPKMQYPYDICYNAVLLNNTLYHNLNYTENKIIEYAKEKNYKLENVRQGYTKCSTLLVTDYAVITSDKGLHKAYKKNNIDTLLIRPRYIGLENFDYGFIGGAGGKISCDKIAFFGNINLHPDFNEINKFLMKHGVSYINMSNDMLTDYGSLISLTVRK